MVRRQLSGLRSRQEAPPGCRCRYAPPDQIQKVCPHLMNPNRSDASFWPDDGVILYDGVCVLCSGWMRFVLRRARLFRFTPIQSDYGRALARALGIDPADPDTNA